MKTVSEQSHHQSHKLYHFSLLLYSCVSRI